MASEMQADVMAAKRALQATQQALNEAGIFVEEISKSLALGRCSVPAPALTEGQIVAALKADPEMAGRVMAFCGFEFSGADTAQFGAAASVRADQLYIGNPRRPGLQSLAVALAAASYRG